MLPHTLHAQPITYTAGKGPRVACGPYIHIRIANDHRFARRGLHLAQQSLHSHWMRFLFFEAVPPVYEAEIMQKPKSIQNRAAEMHRLVREHRHGMFFKKFEPFAHAWIRHGVVEHVRAIVAQEISESGVGL